MNKNLKSVQKILKYEFKDDLVLLSALTHRSFNKVDNYEKLEFLGDSVLQLLVSDYLFTKFPYMSDGELTITRAYAVCGETLSKIGKKLKLDRYIYIGNSISSGNKQKTDGVIADVIESIVGALYTEAGIEKVKEFILPYLNVYIIEYIKSGDNKDYKTKLQQITQTLFRNEPTYVLKDTKGPDHNKTFLVELYINKKIYTKGKGKSKKKAEQNAAMDALKKYKKNGNSF